MGYKKLNPTTVTATVGGAGDIAPTVWGATMSSVDINISISFFELYHLCLVNGPPGSSFTWYVNNKFFETTPHGDLNSWNPSQPLEMSPGDTLTFAWSTGNATTPAPMITAYFRYDNLAQV
jgi:hypothetical protein